MRAALALGLLVTAFCLLWFDRDGLKDNLDGHLSFSDTLYFTAITITTVGYGDIVPVSDRARLIDAFLITPIRLFVWLLFLGTAFDLLFKKSWERWRMHRIQETLNGHIILAGFGRSGQRAAAEMIGGGLMARRLVVVDSDAAACDAARALGAAVMHGDASRNEVLEAVKIEQAAAMVVSAGRDDTSVLIVLTARSLTRSLPIAVTIRAEDNEDLAMHAGATHVINPVQVTGRLLAEAVAGCVKGPAMAGVRA